MSKDKKSGGGKTIALNKKARHDYAIDERFETNNAKSVIRRPPLRFAYIDRPRAIE